MNVEFVTDYFVPIVVAFCLGIGYVLKEVVPTEKVNRFIPLIVAVLGVVFNVWHEMAFTPETVVGGLISGLASTGLYELFRNLIHGREK